MRPKLFYVVATSQSKADEIVTLRQQLDVHSRLAQAVEQLKRIKAIDPTIAKQFGIYKVKRADANSR